MNIDKYREFRWNYDAVHDRTSQKPDTGAKFFIAFAVVATLLLVSAAIAIFGMPTSIPTI